MSDGLTLSVRRVDWPLHEPFVISGWRYESVDTVEVTLTDEQGRSGRGEAVGVDYLGESVDDVEAALAAVDPQGLDRERLQTLLPPGGARNALDCALWDLECRQQGRSIFERLVMDVPGPIVTVGTLSLAAPEDMARAARAHGGWPALKLKLGGGDGLDVARVAAVRDQRPDARLLVDVNGAWSLDELSAAAPALAELGVELIEQPLPRGGDAALSGRRFAVPIGADESCQDSAELDAVADRYAVVNIKLDKCGGLTEALRMVARAEALGLRLMVGNMCGSSLAMAPAMVVAARCTVVDLDGPLLQSRDQDAPLRYVGGTVAFGSRWPWGHAGA